MSIDILYEGTGANGSLEPAIDIVAIHGLNPWNTKDHAVRTWQSESGHLWLRDSLPLEVPNARTLLYEYGSSPGLGTEKDRFIYQANTLLECLRLIRRKNPTRPLILVGHSLGGILIKQALVNAHANPLYKPIINATFGLVFFGTPHAGPTEDSKVSFGRACVSILQSLPVNPSNDIMEALKNGSLYSDVLKENWRHQLEKYRIVSFYEGIGNLVPRGSAIFGLSGDRENAVRLDAKHEEMCRFDPSNKTDRKNYFYVEGNISDLVAAATKETNQANELDFLELWKRIQLNAQNPRFHNIDDAHVDSLKWVWIKDSTGSGFVKWLSEGQGLFWISGKPGSGKSTLMKHIYGDPQTLSYLSHQQQNQVVMIRYFFHELGQALEKQFRGFLSTVLFQLIESFEDIAPEAIPVFKRECNGKRPSTGWICSEKGLKEIFRNINKRDQTRRTVCLFIDGLDECDGDQRSHIQFLTSWLAIRGPFVLKICLASRPLLEIDIRLAAYPGLRIHDWTRNDISACVIDRLNRSATLLQQHSEGPQTLIQPSLIDSIVRNASGVFLWVALVDELIIGLEEGDAEFELQKRLDALPRDLKDLYARILDKVSVHNLHDTINYFSLLMAATFQVATTNYLGLLHFTLATRSPQEALFIPVRADPSSEEFVGLCKQMVRRLQNRCRSLVQVIPARENKKEGVDTRTSAKKLFESSMVFIHRTVKEYLRKPEVNTSLRSKVDPKLLQDPHVHIMASCLRLLKTDISWPIWPLEAIHSEVVQSKSDTQDSWWEERSLDKAAFLLDEIISRAISAEYSTSSAQTKHLDELDRVLCRVHPHWAGNWYQNSGKENVSEHEIDMLAIAARRNLILYVKGKLVTEDFKARRKSARPLLQAVFDVQEEYLLYLPMTKLLLGHGAQTNEIRNGVSIWENVLLLCLLEPGPADVDYPENWRSVFVLMLQHGADANLVVAKYDGFSTALILTIQKLTPGGSLEEWSSEDYELIRTFLNCGANPDATNSDGDSARSLATLGSCNPRVLEIISSFQPTLQARKRRHSRLSDE